MIKLKDKYDVIVIGAGPAGSTTARYAAKNGASVLIVERDREPGIPVRCAEGIAYSGMSAFFEPDEKLYATRIKGGRFVSPDGSYIDIDTAKQGYVLERRLFDKHLCELAIEEGAVLVTKADATGLIYDNGKISGVKLSLMGQEKEISCDIVVGADGIESRVGRWAGIKTNFALEDMETSIQYSVNGVEIPDNYCQFHFGKEVAPGGYLWVFPKSKTSANIGIGVPVDLVKKNGKTAREYLDKFMAKNYPNVSITAIVCGGVPIAAPLKEPAIDNLMLVGDAAKQVNPLDGAGIANAMIAGSIAGRVAGEAVKKKDFSKKMLSKYSKEWHRELGKKLTLYHSMKGKVFGMSDEQYNNLVGSLKALPKEELNFNKMFKIAFKNSPKLILALAGKYITNKFRLKF